jgi:hypothetical protein
MEFEFTPRTETNDIGNYIITLWDGGSDNDDGQFFDFLNVPLGERDALFDQTVSRPILTFNNVWNRKPADLYFHASFVNHTQFNFLGQDRDFYTKPSKIYSADNLPMDFYFWLTTDIMKPIVLPFERFIIELAFIIDSTEYQSP